MYLNLSAELSGFLFVAILILFTAASETLVATECFGSVLSLSCRPGHRIKVIDDFFGLSKRTIGTNMCSYVDGDCTVTNDKFTSVAYRYCEGRQSCISFQIEQRPCMNNVTNYQQVEYECVPDTDITNFCTHAEYQAVEGYLASPNFPKKYPPNLHCVCRLEIQNGGGAMVRLTATRFMIKYDKPCKDWLDIETKNRKRRLCGAYRSTIESQDMTLTFHSDDKGSHSGVWLHFTVEPWEAKNVVKVTCGKYIATTTSTSTTTTTLATLPTTTTTTSTTTTSTPSITDRSKSPLSDDIMKLLNEIAASVRLKKQQQILQEKHAPTFPNIPLITMDNPKPTSTPFAWSSTTPTTRRTVQPTTRFLLPTTTKLIPIIQPENTTENKEKVEDSTNHRLRMKKYRQIGLAIIFVCVGGIVLLLLILTALLCAKRKQDEPQHPANEEKNRRLNRLNSLNFYDSIPLKQQAENQHKTLTSTRSTTLKSEVNDDKDSAISAESSNQSASSSRPNNAQQNGGSTEFPPLPPRSLSPQTITIDSCNEVYTHV